ncbi:hypothetical protein HK405_002517, partial [Cladochytrium tenue]
MLQHFRSHIRKVPDAQVTDAHLLNLANRASPDPASSAQKSSSSGRGSPKVDREASGSATVDAADQQDATSYSDAPRQPPKMSAEKSEQPSSEAQ